LLAGRLGLQRSQNDGAEEDHGWLGERNSWRAFTLAHLHVARKAFSSGLTTLPSASADRSAEFVRPEAPVHPLIGMPGRFPTA
jgi:hypothetical protein